MQNHRKIKCYFNLFCAFFKYFFHIIQKITSGGIYFELKNKNCRSTHEGIDLYRHLFNAGNPSADSAGIHVFP